MHKCSKLIISDLNLSEGSFVLATIHRQENTDDLAKLSSIFEALDRIHKDCEVVLPLHPRTKNILEKNNIATSITLIDPVGYYAMLELLKNCKMVVSDSGGLQKEAFFNNKHCIIAREETEWIELVENGFAEVVGSDVASIMQAFEKFQHSEKDFSMELYGNNVGEKIYQSIKSLIE